jgi:hypothetical protein
LHVPLHPCIAWANENNNLLNAGLGF